MQSKERTTIVSQRRFFCVLCSFAVRYNVLRAAARLQELLLVAMTATACLCDSMPVRQHAVPHQPQNPTTILHTHDQERCTAGVQVFSKSQAAFRLMPLWSHESMLTIRITDVIRGRPSTGEARTDACVSMDRRNPGIHHVAHLASRDVDTHLHRGESGMPRAAATPTLFACCTCNSTANVHATGGETPKNAIKW